MLTIWRIAALGFIRPLVVDSQGAFNLVDTGWRYQSQDTDPESPSSFVDDLVPVRVMPFDAGRP